MKTRTSSYKLLRKRHNYGGRGSEPSALAHVGRALNDELDTVCQGNGRDRMCLLRRKKERVFTRVRVSRRSADRLPIFPAISSRSSDKRRCRLNLSRLSPAAKVTKYLSASYGTAFSMLLDKYWKGIINRQFRNSTGRANFASLYGIARKPVPTRLRGSVTRT